MFLQELLYGKWEPPTVVRTIRHTILGPEKKKSEPVHARVKILKVLDQFNWMSNKEIAEMTCLQINTVQTTTGKLYEKKRVERKVRKEAGDPKPIYLYRRK